MFKEEFNKNVRGTAQSCPPPPAILLENPQSANTTGQQQDFSTV